MARIRSIKPEFWSSEQIVECSPSARLLFIGMWSFADDGGVIPDKPIQIKMQVFPGDSFTKEQVSELVGELIEAGLVKRFENKNQSFLWVTGWERHQRVDRPTRKYPGPLDDGSTIDRRGLGEPSSSARSGVEGSGGDRRGEEGRGREDSAIGDKSPTPPDEGEPDSVLTIPLIDKTEYGIFPNQVTDWLEAFPAVNVVQELHKCRQWNIANPKNRKTRAGILRHVTAWLAKEQDKAPRVNANGKTQPGTGKETLFERSQRQADQAMRKLENDVRERRERESRGGINSPMAADG